MGPTIHSLRAGAALPPRTAPPGATPQAEPQPVDQATLTPNSEAPPRRRKALKWFVRGGVMLAASLSGLAGIGYFGNRAALQEPPRLSLSLPLEAQLAPPAQQSAPAPVAHSRVTTSGGAIQAAEVVRPPTGGVSILLPQGSATRFSRQLRSHPELQKQLEQVARDLNQRLARVEIPRAELLLDLEAPLPVGQQAFFHLGEVDLPSLGFRQLERTTLPLALDLAVNPIESGLKLEVKPTETDSPTRPDSLKGPGVYLGSLELSIAAEKPEVELAGTAQLKLDLDGEATRARLPGQTGAGRKALEARLESARKLREVGSESAFGSLLREGFEAQDADFAVAVKSARTQLASVRFDVWLGQDVTGDGQSDLHLAQQADTQGLDALDISLTRLERHGHSGAGWLGKTVNDQVHQQFHQGIRDGVAQAVAQLRVRAEEMVAQGLDRGVSLLSQHGNQELEQLYRRARGFDLGNLDLHLSSLRMSDQGVLVGLDGKTLDEGVAPVLPPSFSQHPEAIVVTVASSELEARMAALDWSTIMGKVNQANSGYSIALAQKDGKTVLPRLIWHEGQPALVAEVVATQKAAPKQGLSAFLQSVTPASVEARALVPFALGVEDGQLKVTPDLDHFELERHRQAQGFQLADLLPDKALAAILRSLVGEAGGSLKLPIQQDGVELVGAAASQGPLSTVRFHVQAQLGPEVMGRISQ
ncbi:MAG: hypothetical protein KC910_03280 [Candidatus Eremiobacteraeota bacterium]|nr:hypothetical protein [Candidatus Eremiobacteraeota bacterium]